MREHLFYFSIMTSFYATTLFHQNDQEFRCTWDLTATKGNPSQEEIIHHLAAMLEENFPETWNLDEESDDEDADEDSQAQTTLNLHGVSPEDFARELVLNEAQAAEHFGTTWLISTKWEEVDSENWDHPCNV